MDQGRFLLMKRLTTISKESKTRKVPFSSTQEESSSVPTGKRPDNSSSSPGTYGPAAKLLAEGWRLMVHLIVQLFEDSFATRLIYSTSAFPHILPWLRSTQSCRLVLLCCLLTSFNKSWEKLSWYTSTSQYSRINCYNLDVQESSFSFFLVARHSRRVQPYEMHARKNGV